MDPMDLATWAGGALLVVGAVGALYRIVRGPSLLDRAVATDVLLVVFAGMLVLEMAVHRHTHHVVLVVLAAAVGFVGSAESKLALVQHPEQVPYLVVHGRRGGSALCASAVNALAPMASAAATSPTRAPLRQVLTMATPG